MSLDLKGACLSTPFAASSSLTATSAGTGKPERNPCSSPTPSASPYRSAYSEKQVKRTAAFQKKASNVAKYLTFFILAQGLVWCCYYLVLGAIDPEQVDYATGMSQLIVSVLTIVSIAFAFFEFLRSK